MPDYIINPPWWVLLFLSVILAKRWDAVERRIGTTANFLMTHTSGKLLKALRGHKLRKALNKRTERRNPIQVTLLITKGQTYLLLFVLFGMTTAGFLTAASITTNPQQSQFLFLSILASIPFIFFEIRWLITSSKAARYANFLSSLRDAAMRRKLLQPSAKIATRREIEAHILQAALARVGYKDMSVAAKTHLNTYDYYEDHDFEYNDNNFNSGRIIIYSYKATDTFHFRVINSDSPSAICLTMDLGMSSIRKLDRLI